MLISRPSRSIGTDKGKSEKSESVFTDGKKGKSEKSEKSRRKKIEERR